MFLSASKPMAEGEGSKPKVGSMLQGRGGAGNIAPRSPALGPSDLQTPVIKSDLYTTGRGGTGNMALNLHSHPELARASQDVDTPLTLGREPENSVHYGRGGAANIAHMSKEAKASAKERNEKRQRLEASGQTAVAGAPGQEPSTLAEKEELIARDEAAKGKEPVDQGEGEIQKVKNKNVLEKGFAKLTRVMSGNGKP